MKKREFIELALLDCGFPINLEAGIKVIELADSIWWLLDTRKRIEDLRSGITCKEASIDRLRLEIEAERSNTEKKSWWRSRKKEKEKKERISILQNKIESTQNSVEDILEKIKILDNIIYKAKKE